MKLLWSEFLSDFQNVDTQIFRKASTFQKKIFKNFNWGLKDLKMTKNTTFWWKNIKILSYRSFWVPLVIPPIILNIFFWKLLAFLKIWIPTFWNLGKNSAKIGQTKKKNPYFPICSQKIGVSYAKFWKFSKKIGKEHIKTKMTQFVLVPPGSDNITFFWTCFPYSYIMIRYFTLLNG